AAYSIFSTASRSASVIRRKEMASSLISAVVPAPHHPLHGTPQFGLALRLLHQQLQARQRPGIAQAVDLQLTVESFGIRLAGETNRRQADQPQAGARLCLQLGGDEALHVLQRGLRSLVE